MSPSAETPEGKAPRKKPTPAQRKLNAYVAPEIQEAIKRAHYWTSNRPHPGGYRTFSALVEDVLRAKAEELQNAFNDGQPFDPIPDGDALQQGRPLGQ